MPVFERTSSPRVKSGLSKPRSWSTGDAAAAGAVVAGDTAWLELLCSFPGLQKRSERANMKGIASPASSSSSSLVVAGDPRLASPRVCVRGFAKPESSRPSVASVAVLGVQLPDLVSNARSHSRTLARSCVLRWRGGRHAWTAFLVPETSFPEDSHVASRSRTLARLACAGGLGTPSLHDAWSHPSMTSQTSYRARSLLRSHAADRLPSFSHQASCFELGAAGRTCLPAHLRAHTKALARNAAPDLSLRSRTNSELSLALSSQFTPLALT